MPDVVQGELARLDPQKMVALGGEKAVDAAAVQVLDDHAPVTRLAGDNRYGTAAAVTSLWTGGSSTVYVASGPVPS